MPRLPCSIVGAALVALPLAVRGLQRLEPAPASLYETLGLGESDDAGSEQQTPREKLLWKMAALESSVTPAGISSFGRKAAKYPKSWVDKVLALDHTKKYRYSFQGAGFTATQLHYRKWLFKFIKANFGEKDYLRFTDAPSHYRSMGVFDHTNSNEPGGFHPKGQGAQDRSQFDQHYYEVMAASNYTLCPGGETPWSMRLYESALTGSIPMIQSEEGDLTPPPKAAWLAQIGYGYVKTKDTGPNLEYRQDMVDKNRKLFLRYQTFMEGDNDPAHPPKEEDTPKPEEHQPSPPGGAPQHEAGKDAEVRGGEGAGGQSSSSEEESYMEGVEPTQDGDASAGSDATSLVGTGSEENAEQVQEAAAGTEGSAAPAEGAVSGPEKQESGGEESAEQVEEVVAGTEGSVAPAEGAASGSGKQGSGGEVVAEGAAQSAKEGQTMADTGGEAAGAAGTGNVEEAAAKGATQSAKEQETIADTGSEAADSASTDNAEEAEHVEEPAARAENSAAPSDATGSGHDYLASGAKVIAEGADASTHEQGNTVDTGGEAAGSASTGSVEGEMKEEEKQGEKKEEETADGAEEEEDTWSEGAASASSWEGEKNVEEKQGEETEEETAAGAKDTWSEAVASASAASAGKEAKTADGAKDGVDSRSAEEGGEALAQVEDAAATGAAENEVAGAGEAADSRSIQAQMGIKGEDAEGHVAAKKKKAHPKNEKTSSDGQLLDVTPVDSTKHDG